MLDYAARRRLVAAALGVALLGALWLAFARAEEPSGEIVTVLQPGENLVGWIADEAPVGDLFAAAPAIEVVWAWDAQGHRWQAASPRAPDELHSLQTLRPGMGLLVWVGGDQPVEWRRSAVPARGLVELWPGRNLVAWAGPDDSSIAWLSKGIGVSLVSAGVPSSGETGWSIYDPEDAATAEAFPAVSRGDALWVDVSRNINWLQPTGVLPAIEFPGGAAQSLREQARSDLESVLEFYGENYGIQADFAQLTVYVPKDYDSWAESLGITPTAEGRDNFDYLGAHASVDGNYFLVPQSDFSVGVRGALGQTGVRYTFTHEYFHALQSHLSPHGLVTNWLIEGVARWMQVQHGDADGFEDWDRFYAQKIDVVRNQREVPDHPIISRVTSLESVELHQVGSYEWGAVASELLAEHAGENALVEFWRLLGDPLDESGLSWREVFPVAFGVSTTDFYSVFCRFRRGETMLDYAGDSPPCLDDDVRMVSGVLVDDDGTAISGALISVKPLDGTGSINLGARTDSRGRFTIRFSGIGVIRTLGIPGIPVEFSVESLRVRVVVNDLCEGWYAADGLVGRTAATIPFEDNVADIRIQLPAETCRRIEGAVVGPDGVGLPGAKISLFSSRGADEQSYTASDGSFAFRGVPPHGLYSLGVHLRDGCTIRFAGGDDVTDSHVGTDRWSAADLNGIRVVVDDVTDSYVGTHNWSAADLNGIRVVVPENACRWEVRGRLVDSAGEGVANGSVRLHLRDETGPSPGRVLSTELDGSFSYVVPLPGEYQIASEYQGCRWYYSEGGGATFDRNEAALLSLRTRDVSGLVVRLTEDDCRWAVRGRLIDFYGDGAAGERVVLCHHDETRLGPHCREQQTEPDGSFSFAVPQPGEYQIQMISSWSQHCRRWYYSEDGGVTLDRNEAALLSLRTGGISDLVLRVPEAAWC